MALKRDNSELPPKAEGPGAPPDAVPRFGLALVNAWAAASIPEGERPHAIEGTTFRLSWAGKCARDLSYWMQGLEPSNPLDLADYWRFGLGTMVHEALQTVFIEAFPGAEIEKKVDLRELDPPLDGSGHIDIYVARVPETNKSTVIEVKTINGFGFKRAIGARGAAEGPRSNAIRQGALEAYAVDADELVLCYLSLELLSVQEFNRFGGVHDAQKFVAEWTYTRDDYMPIALFELNRVKRVSEILAQGELVPRSHPDLPTGARITDPDKGIWQVVKDGQIIDAGTTWICGYCGNRDRCFSDGVS